MAAREKGTVTSLSSMFPAEEARKASHRLHELIAEKNGELQNLQTFVSDNSNLINLVKRLPDQLHHNIMVPFGKAAFFPGRLVHTNEFMVLLGEGYYAERTAKQAVDILKRRGKTLESQIDAVKAVIEDIKAKASFFDKTAEEAVEGLVEIREEFLDEDSVENLEKSDAPSVSEVNSGAEVVYDEEYARIMSRLDELEREELEAEEQEDIEHDEDTAKLLGRLSLQTGNRVSDESSSDKDMMHTQMFNPAERNCQPSILKSTAESSPKNNSKVSFQLPNAAAGSQMSRPVKHRSYVKPDANSQMPRHVTECSNAQQDAGNQIFSAVTDGSNSKPNGGNQISRPVTDHSNSKPDIGSQLSKPVTDSLKAFTGTIVERADNLQLNPQKQTSQPAKSQPSKPVSRFKMQRR